MPALYHVHDFIGKQGKTDPSVSCYWRNFVTRSRGSIVIFMHLSIQRFHSSKALAFLIRDT